MRVVVKPGPGRKQLQNLLNALSGNEVGKVGWFDTNKTEKGTARAYIAAIHEFGAPEKNIPSRSFMRTTIAEKQKSWGALAERGAKGMLHGENLASVLDKIGFRAKIDIQQKIKSITTPKLADSTVERKGSSKPLVDTGIMLQSIQNTVEPK